MAYARTRYFCLILLGGMLLTTGLPGRQAMAQSQPGDFLDIFISSPGGGLDDPSGLVFGPDGHLYVISFNTGAVLRYNGMTGAFIDKFVAARSGGLIQPSGLVFGPDGHLYVSSFLTDEVLRYDGTTGASMGVFVSAASGGLSLPSGLVFGPDGHLYVSSVGTDEVLRYVGPVSTALFALYNSTGGDNWTTNTNWLNGPLDTWHGLTLDANGEVTEISLIANNLVGTLPPELSTLSNLTQLNLRDNALTGAIPTSIGSLANLVALELQGNGGLSGPIPPELGNLTSLGTLALEGNQLTGPIPPELGNLANLGFLGLDTNQLTGMLPPELGNLTALERLYLGSNQLEGNIPESYGMLASLREFIVADNPSMSGTLPLALTGLTLDFFAFASTGLCENLDPAFQAWLATIATVVSSGCTNVGTEAEGALPTDFVLEQSYPNPFNPQTTIRYGLPETASVRLLVYDTIGRLVRVLVEGMRSAGWQEVVFEAGDLPSGVYLYRLEAGSFQGSGQMLLVK